MSEAPLDSFAKSVRIEIYFLTEEKPKMKYVLFLGDGMADEPIEELGGKTPLMVANTPNMDRIAREGRCGTFLTLPDGFPTSSDVANLSVFGYDLAKCYTGRGPLESAAQGIDLPPDEVAFRCNLIAEKDGILEDYSGGHIKNEESRELIKFLNEKFGSPKIKFYPGVSYRNLLILKGEEFCEDVDYQKPDSSHGLFVKDLLAKARSPKADATVKLINELTLKSKEVLESHPINKNRAKAGELMANMIWPWSPGRKPAMETFKQKYGKSGAVISAVDVIYGIGFFAEMKRVNVPGATGWIDTDYEAKADYALKVLEEVDFVYLHVEAIDEVGHLGQLDKKIKAIEDFDRRLIGRFLSKMKGEFSAAVLPDHPVPVKLRKHTRTPVPFAIMKPGVKPDSVLTYDESSCLKGDYGFLKGDQLLKALFE